MAWSVLQEAKAASQPSSGNNVATFSTANLTAGTKLVAWISISSSAGTDPVTSIKDGAGNTFTKGWFKETVATNCWVEMYFLDTPAGDVGTKPTITATLTTNFGSAMIIQEVSGLLVGNTTACLDGTAGLNTGSSTGPATSGAYSSTAANEWLAFAAGDPGFSVTFATPTTGYTASGQNTNASNLADLEVGWKNSGNGSESGSSTFTGGTADWATGLVAFKLAAGAGATDSPVQSANPGPAWQRRFKHRQTSPSPQPLDPSVAPGVIPLYAVPGQTWQRRFKHRQTPPSSDVSSATPVLNVNAGVATALASATNAQIAITDNTVEAAAIATAPQPQQTIGANA